MAGVRTLALAALAMTAVALLGPGGQQPVRFDMVDGGNGLAVMRNEVTIGQWRQCVSDGGCSFMPRPGPGALDDNYPVTGVGALDASEFAAWAAHVTGEPWRLPTLEEWYGFSGVEPFRPKKIFTDPRLAWAATYGAEGVIDPTLQKPSAFGVNGRGIADVHGNVWEWTATCVVPALAGDDGHCPAYFAAGEHEAKVPVFVRDPSAGGCATGTPPAHLGLRLVRDLPPQS